MRNETFLQAVFGPATPWTSSTETPRGPFPYRPPNPEQNTYYSISTFNGDSRRVENWAALHVLVLDDVGRKYTAAEALAALALAKDV